MGDEGEAEGVRSSCGASQIGPALAKSVRMRAKFCRLAASEPITPPACCAYWKTMNTPPSSRAPLPWVCQANSTTSPQLMKTPSRSTAHHFHSLRRMLRRTGSTTRSSRRARSRRVVGCRRRASTVVMFDRLSSSEAVYARSAWFSTRASRIIARSNETMVTVTMQMPTSAAAPTRFDRNHSASSGPARLTAFCR